MKTNIDQVKIGSRVRVLDCDCYVPKDIEGVITDILPQGYGVQVHCPWGLDPVPKTPIIFVEFNNVISLAA